jgi:hypothetical protein
MTDILEVFQEIVKQDKEIFHRKLNLLDINKPDNVFKDKNVK